MKKTKIGVVFGGKSGEHEVSLVSAASVMSALDKNRYEIVPIGITKEGRWFSGENVVNDLKNGIGPDESLEVAIFPEPTRKGLYFLSSRKNVPLDVVFPVLHGPYGEDGTIQGLFEMAGIAYVGAGVLGSSVGMDKIIQKEIARQNGLKTSDWISFLAKDFKENSEKIIGLVEKNIGYPSFVKPSNSGSSVGISKAHNKKELMESIADAVRYDRRVLVEKGVESAREIEVSVLGNDDPIASVPGEVIPSNEFYDYDAKYVDGKSKTVIPADLPKDFLEKVRNDAIKIFKALDLAGMSRVDFLVTKKEIYFNEVNTIPGFTSISMYPKMWEASGIGYPALLDKLVNFAIERSVERSKLLTSYQPKEKWYG